MRFLLSGLLALSLSSAAVLPSSSPISYDGCKVIRVKTGSRLSAVRNSLSRLPLQIWNEDVATHIDVVVPSDQLAAFEELNLDSHVMHEDLGRSIAEESAVESLWKRQDADNLTWYDSYHLYEDHIQYFKDLQAAFPNNSEWVSTGTSYEGRDLYGIHLWGASGPGKPAVLFHATVHAREWIATPVAEYITHQLINGYNANDNVTRSFVDNYDFYIFPIVNPDGFVYTQTTDRQWRKNRQPPPTSANSSCLGTDINRNWPFAWDPDSGGSSSSPCDETYAGSGPSSSPENQGLVSLVSTLHNTTGIKLYLDFHSYGQDILFPYGYNETALLPQLPKWERSGSLISAAIRDSNASRHTTFTYGPGGAILYKSVGNSRDHVYALGGADFSWTVELPDTGDYGFVLPPDQILPVVQEQWAGQLVLLSLLDEVFFDGVGIA